MRFLTFGEKGRPTAVLIHGMFMDAELYRETAEILSEQYFVVLPVLSGHGEGDPERFLSVEAEARAVLTYLASNGVTKLEMLGGSSLGGIVATEVLRQAEIPVERTLIDGAPFFLFPAWKRKLTEAVFQSVARSSKKSPEKKNFLDFAFPEEAEWMKTVAGRMDRETIANLSRACYTYRLPEEAELQDGKLFFLYGTKERARKAAPALAKYRRARVRYLQGYRHCGLILTEPKRYAELLRTF